MFKIHTFEMQKLITSNAERNWLWQRLKGIQFEKNQAETYVRFRYYGLAGKGVIITLFWYKYTGWHKICVQINPCTVLGIQKKKMLFDVREDGFLQCLRQVDKILCNYQLSLGDYRVTRVDFTQDVWFERSEIIDIVISLLRKTGAPRGYHNTRYGDTVYDDSYNIMDCEGSEVVVYNKERQYADRDEEQSVRMKGIMRIEARTRISNQMKQIFIDNEPCFSNLLIAREYAEIKIKNVFVEGFYIKVKKTKEILGKECIRKGGSKRHKNRVEKMMEFAEGVAVHQSLGKCIKGKNALFCYDTTKSILAHFGERRINLVSISAREQAIVIPDMLYILGMKSEVEMQRDIQFLRENNLLDKIPVFELL